MMIKKLLCILLAMSLLLGIPILGGLAVASSVAEDQAIDEIDEIDDEGDFSDPDDDWLYAEDDGTDYADDAEDDEDDGSEWLTDVANDGEIAVDSLGDPEEDDLMGAMDVFSWFVMQPLDVDESLPDSSGTMWRVLDERFNTKEGMLDMLGFYFSDEIVNELWTSNANPYKEIGGYLYTDGEGRGMDDRIGETELTIASKTATRVDMDMAVYYIESGDGGEATDTFHYVRELINGEWKYTEFPFFW